MFALALAVGLTLTAVSCSPKAESAIIGKWSHQGDNTTITFTKDGKAVNVENGQTMNADYSIKDGNTLTLKITGAEMSIDFDVAFPSDKEMTLTMHLPKDFPKGMKPPPMKAETFTRVSN